MTEPRVTQNEYEAVTRLGAAQRYEHTIKRVADCESVWSLTSPGGWVLVRDDEGHECVPVWPHSRYAEQWSTDEWSDAMPERISLDEWIGFWLPGIEKDGRLVAVFPTPEHKGVVVSPMRMRRDLLDYLKTWYDEGWPHD